jgi:uncharacterized membrane protein YfcA
VVDLPIDTVAILVAAAFAAGFVDALAGGGGLIQLPALLLWLPGATPLQVLATNKFSSICGTSVSAATYYRRIRPDPATFGPLMVAAFSGSVAGALVARQLPREVFEPLVLVVLLVVGAWVLLRPTLGAETALRFTGRRHLVVAMVAGFAVGAYDGAMGPGTGSFFLVVLAGGLGYSFLDASAKARLANWATNLAALCVFIPAGGVVWAAAIPMGLANVVGGYLGARLAIAKGSRWVRAFLLVVIVGFAVRLGAGLLTG